MEISPGPIRRREFLRVGGLAFGGLGLGELLAARQNSKNAHADTSVILLYLHGGPSQLETYDLKPDAPSTYRSVFSPISTNVPGLDICELFPRQAKIADKFSLVRSLNHDVGIHSDGGIVVLTGKRPTKLDPTSQSKSEHPDFGSVTSRVRDVGPGAIPPYIAIPRQAYMTRPTYLGLHHKAFEVNDPSSKTYRPPQIQLAGGRDIKRLSDRRLLLQQLDQFRSDVDIGGGLQGIEDFQDVAFEMLTSPQLASAFDISKEPDKLRDRYGRHLWGQGCLLARRLAEAGAGVISLYFNTPKTGQEFTNWDDHIQNAGRPGHFAKYMRVRLPYMDEALAALIEDIFDRGLNQKILLVVVGEFGRTPRLSQNANGTGRDHWPQAYTALVSGGGLRMGCAIGSTNSKAEYPMSQPHSPQDLLATIYRHLGIDPQTTFQDFSGRPIPILPDGKPISGLL